VILSVAPAEKAAAAVDATELELVLVERVSNSRIDTVICGSFPTRVIIVKKAERSWREKLRETTAGLANVIVSVRVIDEREVELPTGVNQLLARGVRVSRHEFYVAGEVQSSEGVASVLGQSLFQLHGDNLIVSAGVANSPS
jgi:hypothetical protein